MIHFLACFFLNGFVIGISVVAEELVNDGVDVGEVLFENTEAFGMIFGKFFKFLVDD